VILALLIRRNKLKKIRRARGKLQKMENALFIKKILNPCGESDQLIVHLNFAKNG